MKTAKTVRVASYPCDLLLEDIHQPSASAKALYRSTPRLPRLHSSPVTNFRLDRSVCLARHTHTTMNGLEVAAELVLTGEAIVAAVFAP